MPHGKGICKCHSNLKGRVINSKHGPGICSCPNHQDPSKSSQTRKNFRELFGDGPFKCGEKKMGCGESVMFWECVVDHVDENRFNNDPSNWQAMHVKCHNIKSGLMRSAYGVNQANALLMNSHENNSSEARSKRAKQQHAEGRFA
jgi:hypothetical protein